MSDAQRKKAGNRLSWADEGPPPSARPIADEIQFDGEEEAPVESGSFVPIRKLVEQGFLQESLALAQKHCFQIDAELAARIAGRYGQQQAELSQLDEARRDAIRPRLRGIVASNDLVMQEGGFETPEGRQVLPAARPAERYHTADVPRPLAEPLCPITRVCVADADTITAALEVGEACALNFANEEIPGGLYRHGAKAQEEDLCRQIPELIACLEASEYPIEPGTALLSRSLHVMRRPGTYELCQSLGQVDIITAAMPQYFPVEDEWTATVNLRIRAVLEAGKRSGRPNLVLGAFGCGMFGNPPQKVADIFRQQLASGEFRGAFSSVVFAIIGPERNRIPFATMVEELAREFSEQTGGIAEPCEASP